MGLTGKGLHGAGGLSGSNQPDDAPLSTSIPLNEAEQSAITYRAAFAALSAGSRQVHSNDIELFGQWADRLSADFGFAVRKHLRTLIGEAEAPR